MESYKVVMPYIGGILSKNAYKTKNRATKLYVRYWMKELASKSKALSIPLASKYTIELSGFFTDNNSRPDIHNLHEVIADALKMKEGLSVDDKYFFFYDKEVKLGYFDPYLEIVIVPEGILVSE